ncbi:hypothetical protein VHEMI02927 [[Torrubiella] hemipterigena]|uniref:UDP-glucose:Glycoprotein Glucosyltransferase n=1 Tax=[Torrubiella] hemipterigena TaxID=1531966 RepID=A0A0A1T9L2_9HYPO|nr:hypothetical protein VHEMI02927 [[Torrubiella] hemipterigena]
MVLTLFSQTEHVEFDRTLGSGKDAILYADPTSPKFGSYHQEISKMAAAGDVRYRLRYRRPNTLQTNPLPVSGYGVELALKRTDYIVIDDRDAGSQDSPKEKNQDTGSLEREDEEELSDIAPLSSSDLEGIGMKAASFIQQSKNPFETLIKLTQDFPRYSSIVARHVVSEEFAKEYEQAAEQRVPVGVNVLWINGMQLTDRQIQPFALISMLRRERQMLNEATSLGFSSKEVVSLLGHEKVAEANSDDSASLRYDWRDGTEDNNALVWLNDLENDEQYKDHPKTPRALLQRAYPGTIPPVGLNIFHAVTPVDFDDSEDIEMLTQLLTLVNRGITVRFGLVPALSSARLESTAKLVYYIMDTYGLPGLATLLEAKTNKADDKAALDHVATSNEPSADKKILELEKIQSSELYGEQVKSAEKWQSRLKASAADGKVMFVNGAIHTRSESWMQSLGMQITEDLQTVQRAIFQGELTDEESIAEAVFLTSAALRRNPYLSGGEGKPQVLDVNAIYSNYEDLFQNTPTFEASKDSAKEFWAAFSIISDFTSAEGRALVLAALEFKRQNDGVRLDFVHNPAADAPTTGIQSALKTKEDELKLVTDESQLGALVKSLESATSSTKVQKSLELLLSSAKLLSGHNYVLLNGRVVGPILADAPFLADDFSLLLDIEHKARIAPVYAAAEDLGLSEKLTDPVSVAKITSLVARSTVSDVPEGIFDSAPSTRSTLYDKWDLTHAKIEVGNPDTASVHLVGLINPLSEQGQKWAPILKVLADLDGVYLKLFLNPKTKITELPIKRFFRYVLESKPTFDARGNVKAPRGTFRNLPTDALLTAGMDVPPAWLVSAKSSVYDLDNIKLSSAKSDVDATYELEHILIEGHSREVEGGAPRGAQLVLGTKTDDHVTDTIIMANLGFFQFKANPGFYNIRLKDGRSADIYNIESIGTQGYNAVPGDEGTRVVLMDFEGTTLYPRLQRNSGMEEADVLAEPEDGVVAKGLKFAEGILGGLGKSASAKEHADINIFSVASGHLYERMLNIMMVSVMKHTKRTVKFWFIEQFLSPSFKDFIPELAKEYGFKYEMVTYKWPHWLRQQKEKQREIWGYKILFLDVLFPLSLDKVIFVDADQIVRTDMMDLVNLDLEGAPYGFTPMCDSRTEMEGFRFWKQGYWERYLRGKPYHISALYVVDLRRFREIAAGDRLRQQYHQLSADPNSLANLDQDLPNHMQFQLPIHSLPQEWLWCETWCSDESQAQARTIDLCNNPQTKEPKLDRARRQVPEWTVYDDEIAAVAKRSRKEEINTKSRAMRDPVHTKDEL